MESQNVESEEIGILDQETPTGAPDDREVMRRLLAEVAEMRKENQQLKSEVAKIKTKPRRQLFQRTNESDPECSNAVRKVCKELSKNQQQQEDGEDREDQENQLQFDLSTSFDSPSNQAMAKKVLSEVRSVYGKKKWEKAIIRVAVRQHWRSLRDDSTRKTNRKFEDHRRQVKQSNRLKRKLSRRISSLEKTALSDQDKAKAQEILCSPNAVQYMSSEESDNDDGDSTRGPKPRKTRKLQWERTKLRNLKSRLDQAYHEGLSERQRRTSARVVRTQDLSERPSPTNGPSWAVRQ